MKIQKQETKPASIVVVDDEIKVAEVISDTLSSKGYDVKYFCEPSESLEFFKNHSAQMLITDIRMPSMDGINLARKTRELVPDIGIVFITGYGDIESAQKAVREGALDYIIKPFDGEEISHSIENAFKRLKLKKPMKMGFELTPLYEYYRDFCETRNKEKYIEVSLAMMLYQAEACKGSIIYWDENIKEINVLLMDNRKEPALAREIFHAANDLTGRFQAGTGTENGENLYQKIIKPVLKEINPGAVLPDLIIIGGEHLLSAPIGVFPNIRGIVSINCTDSMSAATILDTKLLQLVALQIFMNLENIELSELVSKSLNEMRYMQEQLIRLEKRASKGEMSAEIGHELNNYLGAIQTNIELIDHYIDKKQYNRVEPKLKSVMSGLKSVNRFVVGLMDFKALRSHKEIHVLNEIIYRTVRFIRPQNKYKDVKIEMELHENIPRLNVDCGQIEQLLFNLISNAADAMENNSGSRLITIRSFPDKTHNTINLSVSDDGCGISEENLNRLFRDRFTTKENGHGLGIIACKKIVDNHGGKISVESMVGKGSTITISIPISA